MKRRSVDASRAQCIDAALGTRGLRGEQTEAIAPPMLTGRSCVCRLSETISTDGVPVDVRC